MSMLLLLPAPVGAATDALSEVVLLLRLTSLWILMNEAAKLLLFSKHRTEVVNKMTGKSV